MDDLIPGIVLVADPFLKDPNFMRSVVFLCEHEEQGSFGFVLNRPYNQSVGDLVGNLEGCDWPVYFGGPVQMDTLHFLHLRPDLIPGGVEITDGICWGGDFNVLATAIHLDQIKPNEVRFYLGYSGWGTGQLAEELKEKSWLTTPGNQHLVYQEDTQQIWQLALQQMGGEYEQLVNYPIDPQLN
jgi:putative transcriptional regulator